MFTIVKSVDSKFVDKIIDEPDFKKLYKDKRWSQLITLIDKQMEMFNAPVAKELIALRKHRVAVEQREVVILNQYGNNSLVFKVFRDSLRSIDSINVSKLKSIINTYGWLDTRVIGENGVEALVFLFQQTKMSTQKFYFPLITLAFKKREIDANDYAVIADRIALFDTGKQIYGTLFKQAGQAPAELFPIENRDSVNIRRSLIGLDRIP